MDLRRSGGLPSPLAVCHADLSRLPILAGRPVIDLALYSPAPDDRSDAACRALFIDGPAALAEAPGVRLRHRGVRRLRGRMARRG